MRNTQLATIYKDSFSRLVQIYVQIPDIHTII
jgi:hypothetical protein